VLFVLEHFLANVPVTLNFTTRWGRVSAATRFVIKVRLELQLMHRPAIYEKKLAGDT